MVAPAGIPETSNRMMARKRVLTLPGLFQPTSSQGPRQLDDNGAGVGVPLEPNVSV